MANDTPTTTPTKEHQTFDMPAEPIERSEVEHSAARLGSIAVLARHLAVTMDAKSALDAHHLTECFHVIASAIESEADNLEDLAMRGAS